ncbi:sulfotransferase domain-containing protein [Leisingera aquaemixtae]|uniref:sulfotransferase family protein n=1 Tax=Leisingera aquaemixtae TaxID=1396826 RepID=UPI001C978C08|nr:sulfotransferase [Leisingera aquaemixtae]MBY6069103.1 sulfotransferase domain-containing protein [Leisingera aquaemixtae]
MNSQVRGGKRAPTFLGVGPPKCATTWLDSVLRKHPDVFLPKDQKEVFFFDKFYDRGEQWYEDLFTGTEQYHAAGEISTSYILKSETLQRIHSYNPDLKIIIIFRNPVDRMISNYRMFVENGRTVLPFEEAIYDQEVILEYSRYAQLLSQVLEYFPPDQVLVGIYEEIFESPEHMKEFLQSLLGFMGVDSTNYDTYIETKRVRTTQGAPRSLWLVKKAKYVRSRLNRMDMEWLVRILRKVGIKRELFLKQAPPPAISTEFRAKLLVDFEADIRAVETFLSRPVPRWR